MLLGTKFFNVSNRATNRKLEKLRGKKTLWYRHLTWAYWYKLLIKLHPLKLSGIKATPVATVILNIFILVFKYLGGERNHLLEKWLILRHINRKSTKLAWNVLQSDKARKYSKTSGHVAKVYKNQIEEALIGQIWNNVDIKKSVICNRLYS